jgi:hypothetical protein
VVEIGRLYLSDGSQHQHWYSLKQSLPNCTTYANISQLTPYLRHFRHAARHPDTPAITILNLRFKKIKAITLHHEEKTKFKTRHL